MIRQRYCLALWLLVGSACTVHRPMSDAVRAARAVEAREPVRLRFAAPTRVALVSRQRDTMQVVEVRELSGPLLAVPTADSVHLEVWAGRTTSDAPLGARPGAEVHLARAESGFVLEAREGDPTGNRRLLWAGATVALLLAAAYLFITNMWDT